LDLPFPSFNFIPTHPLGHPREYEVYADISFELPDQPVAELTVYKGQGHLFLPIADTTNGQEGGSYGSSFLCFL
jgi:hypothetical protein